MAMGTIPMALEWDLLHNLCYRRRSRRNRCLCCGDILFLVMEYTVNNAINTLIYRNTYLILF
jgi:hypothetical protein